MGRRTSAAPASKAWAAMTALVWLLLLLLWLGSEMAADGPGGRPYTLSLAAKSKARGVKPGQKLTLKIKWTNYGSADFANGVLQLQLPPHTAFKKATGPARTYGGSYAFADAAADAAAHA